MKLKTILASTAVMASLFTGCAQPGLNTSSSSVYVDPEFQGAPKWVMMPFVNGHICDIGSAPRNAGNDFSFQRDIAMGNARDNLARQISVKVSNMLKTFKSSTGAGTDATFDNSASNVSKQIASETLTNTRVHDSWISSSGTLYVLMVVDTPTVENAMDKSVKTSFKNDKAMYQRFLHAKAQGELEQELEKMDK
jgi:hypothetical protein